MSNDNVITLHPVDRPCDTEESTAPEGYRLQHMAFDNPNGPEPTSSNPFPFVRISNDKLRIQAAHDFFQDIDLTADQFINLGVECLLSARRLLRKEGKR